MLREESDVNAREYHIKLNLGSTLGQRHSCDRREPKGNPSKDSKDGPHRQDVMEMGYYIVSIMESNVQGTISQHDPGQATDGEQE